MGQTSAGKIAGRRRLIRLGLDLDWGDELGIETRLISHNSCLP
jgi:hypothetical protein